MDIPCLHTLIYKHHLSALKKKTDNHDSLMSVLKNKDGKYSNSKNDGDRMLFFAALLVSQCCHSGLAAVIPHIIGCVFANAKVEIDMNKCIDSIPPDKRIYTLVTKKRC